ncbi:MAG: hypothetical protein ACLPLP_13125 [Mycobacterium sp.]
MKIIEGVIAFLFLWLVTTMTTGQIWVWPVVFIGLCLYVFCDERRKLKRRIAEGRKRVRIHNEKVRRAATQDPYEVIQRLITQKEKRKRDTELRAIKEAKRGFGSLLNDEGVKAFCNPN